MKVTFSALGLILISTSLAMGQDEARFNIIAKAVTESGEHLASGTFPISKTDEFLRFTGYSTRGTGKGDPVPMYMLFSYLCQPGYELMIFPLLNGSRWTQEGGWNTTSETTTEGYESVEVLAGTFPKCLLHKTVIIGAQADSELGSALVNGTRYLWFAKGIGLVKMRYEYSNGVTAEAELMEYNVPDKSEEYLPLKIGNTWTYKWQNDYRDEAVIESCRVVETGRTHETPDVGMSMPIEKAT